MSGGPRRSPLAAAALAMLAQAALAQAQPEALPGTTLKVSPELRPASRRDGSAPLPIILLADKIQGRPDLDAFAEGHVEMRRDGTVVRADRFTYDVADDLAKASGNVSISRDGNRFSGPELQLHVQRFEGFFVQPDYYLAVTQAGGHAERVNFIGPQRAEAINATYTSCPRDGSQDPAWLLSTDRVRMDFETNTGIAEGAVVRFYGVPILAAPVLSFPLTDDRKSGWLPPSMNLDSKSGVELGVPYYWNIAPNRDATFTPTVMTRRGVALDTEFRYLQPGFRGRVDWNVLPNDRLTGRSRQAVLFEHEGDTVGAVHYRADLLRVSDDGYWRDFPRAVPSLTPRLLPLDVQADRNVSALNGDWRLYARVQRWQLLNPDDGSTSIVAPPYDRAPQLGFSGFGRLGAGRGALEYSLESELNHFELAEGQGTSAQRPTRGTRVHVVSALAWPFSLPGGWITPRLSVNAADYRYTYRDGSTGPELEGRGSRTVPTFSVDSGMVFERNSRWFGRAMRQTLEPRLLYVNTPYRAQSQLPNFDAAGKDFNEISVYSDNAFAGVDRVSDTHQLAAGVTTRWLDAQTGVEAMRLGIVQRYLFRDQQITPAPQGGVAVEGEPLTQPLSDVLLLASSTIWPHWTVSGAVQYNPDTSRVVRSVTGVRYSPGPFRTVNLNYRFTRGSLEQAELGWQWPIYQSARDKNSSGSCSGSWYGVGRLNYSMRDRRLTDSLVGMEYDAGCWIGRVVAERVSTGRSEATTRLMLQLELVGLSRLGSNPLRALKDNIPGYRLLREERGKDAAGATYD
ncbi:LPS-assembly protein LptD [Ideonella sp. BN130291]|uniref:LPS-assembly protein LptD n=1 Tax=Ideonella sp. BN130291 TaxID=3112940 RepID=UPI002E258C89|nr:LPS assembly protein LptD [Ideonella sp. BN130291]